MKVSAGRLRLWRSAGLLGTFLLSNAPAHSIVRYDGRMAPILRAAVASLPLPPGSYEPFGAWVGGRPCGFGLIRRNSVRSRADVVSVATAAGDGAHEGAPGGLEVDTTAALLRAMADVAATQGVVSLGAAIPDDSPFAAVFEESGFRAAVRERAYTRAPGPARAPTAIAGLRPQQPADAWQICQLYRAITPAAVQQAEGLTADDWDITRGKRGLFGRAGPSPERHVVAGERGLDAWLEIRSDPGGTHRFALMAHPRAADAIGPIVRFALWRLSHSPAALTRVLVRDHEIPLAAGLMEAGFEPAGANRRMIKHLAIRLRAEVPSAAMDRATS